MGDLIERLDKLLVKWRNDVYYMEQLRNTDQEVVEMLRKCILELNEAMIRGDLK